MLLSALGVPAQADSHKHFNTVKQKLAEGKQVVGGTITTSDPTVYCAMAHAGFDFLWIEMQHSPLNYDQAARMIWACRDAPAIPFVRVPKATEGDIQKATDMGALGIVVPMVDSVQEAKDGVTYAKFPPLGKRSHGGGQYGRLWGPRYRELANDNIMVVMMIESPAGVDIVDQVAAIDGVDVVFAASGDIGSFTGWERDDPRYMALIEKIKVETLKAGKVLAGPLAWRDREGFMFFQGPSEGSLIRDGAKVALKQAPEAMKDVATGDEAN
jgi:2-keto-3-deoxy-L-rhamnonate aldolase RhmA